jgi:glucosamine--fructose-6-phosphate aminotransferase (isomerizing)
MALVHTDAYHTMEFRHGPSALADEHALVIGFLHPALRQQENAVIKQMQAQGAHILTVDPAPHMPDWARVVLYYPVCQLIGYHLAVLNGQNPDRPIHLKPYVELESLNE